VHKKVKETFKDQGVYCGKGDEGGWAPQISDEKALKILKKVVDGVSEEHGVEILLGLDVAASELFSDNVYRYSDKKLSPEEQIDHMKNLVDTYGIYYLEDPLEESDFAGFSVLTDETDTLVCGDDLFVTNVERLKKGIDIKAGNSILIKPNQIGTLTDTFQAVKLAKEANYTPVISHRSGETDDSTISHLAVAWSIPIIKTGVVGGERLSKLNELIRIEEGLTKQSMAMIKR